ncbi:MAG: signal peptidase I [Bacillota bacterium]|nr:signal peptidase I [Bacillota bacterium]
MIKRVLLYLAAAVAGIALAVFASQVFCITEVNGTAMEPAIGEDSSLLVNRWAYREKEPVVGDIVAFRSDIYGEEGEGSVLVRRVAGVSGDVVEIKENILYRNGKPYTEHMKEPVHMDDMDEIRLGDGEIFLLSDNRKSSLDSRNEAIGIIETEDCIGKVCFK